MTDNPLEAVLIISTSHEALSLACLADSYLLFQNFSHFYCFAGDDDMTRHDTAQYHSCHSSR